MERYPRLQSARLPRVISERPDRIDATLLRWLDDHATDWAGWSTRAAVDAQERTIRERRLQAMGCPSLDVRLVDDAIHVIRERKRAAYRKQMSREAYD